MRREITEAIAPSLFSRLLARRRSPWTIAGIALLLILASLGAAALDGILVDFFRDGYWRVSFPPTAVVVYILAVSPILEGLEAKVLRSFRPVVQLDEEQLARVVVRATHVSPAAEAMAFAAGAGVGLWFNWAWVSAEGTPWLGRYLFLAMVLMFGLLGWAIYGALASTRLTTALHRQPLRFDLFDLEPFRPIGRYSLAIALVFVGGTVLSMLFGVRSESFLAWQNWAVALVLMLVPIMVFFLNMRDTHRVLAAEKQRELEGVRSLIVGASRTLMRRLQAGEPAGELGAEINALVAYEQRVRAVSTWPYDTATLRTLFVSLIIPVLAELVRWLPEML